MKNTNNKFNSWAFMTNSTLGVIAWLEEISIK